MAPTMAKTRPTFVSSVAMVKCLILINQTALNVKRYVLNVTSEMILDLGRQRGRIISHCVIVLFRILRGKEQSDTGVLDNKRTHHDRSQIEPAY